MQDPHTRKKAVFQVGGWFRSSYRYLLSGYSAKHWDEHDVSGLENPSLNNWEHGAEEIPAYLDVRTERRSRFSKSIQAGKILETMTQNKRVCSGERKWL